jgi:hypothetical protein
MSQENYENASVPTVEVTPPDYKPKLYRRQLTELFKANGLPPLSFTYLNKISSLGEGPPIAMIWNRRPLYDPEEALEWLRAKVQQQTEAARERARQNKEIRQRSLERLRLNRQAAAAA